MNAINSSVTELDRQSNAVIMPVCSEADSTTIKGASGFEESRDDPVLERDLPRADCRDASLARN
jgi:hypothetical protein